MREKRIIDHENTYSKDWKPRVRSATNRPTLVTESTGGAVLNSEQLARKRKIILGIIGAFFGPPLLGSLITATTKEPFYMAVGVVFPVVEAAATMVSFYTDQGKAFWETLDEWVLTGNFR